MSDTVMVGFRMKPETRKMLSKLSDFNELSEAAFLRQIIKEKYRETFPFPELVI